MSSIVRRESAPERVTGSPWRAIAGPLADVLARGILVVLLVAALFTAADWAGRAVVTPGGWQAGDNALFRLLNGVVPVLTDGGRFIPNPAVRIDRWIGDDGQIVYGDFKTGEEFEAARALTARCATDLSRLDAAVETLATKLVHTMPDCLTKTIESVRKKKLEHWQRNAETNRAWLALNMMTEARAGFRAFNEGPRDRREVDFIELRRRLAQGATWDDELFDAIHPSASADIAGRSR